LRVTDERRNVVHVLGTGEARQWELAVVFVCGMVEGQFPAYHSQDAFLPDATRHHLRQNGFRLRTTEDWANYEKFLFDSATSRATSHLILSYPRSNSRGELNLPSLFLADTDIAIPCTAVRPRPARAPVVPRPSRIAASDLLPVLAERHTHLSPTGLESFQQCAFQFFGRTTMKLKAPPERPENRLTQRVQGGIIHQVLAEWFVKRGPLDPMFDRIFDEFAAKESIPAGYRTAVYRTEMLNNLRRFTEDLQWPTGFQSATEKEFTFALGNGVMIRGRMDRLDTRDDGLGFVIDYKYSKTKKQLSSPNLLQGPLYLLAVERAFGLKAGGMLYCNLRDEVKYAGWSQTAGLGIRTETFTYEWLEAAQARGIAAAEQIVSGRTVPAPYDLDLCRYCEVRDICRYDPRAGAAASESA
jgi:ATP-dependent helicase/DNAse subunit B